MTSFLSFVYRRQPVPCSSEIAESDTQPASSHLISKPGDHHHHLLHRRVSSSGSSDTGGDPHVGQDEDASPGRSDTKGKFQESPFTPEGLLPRRSVESLRRELNIPPRVLEHSMRSHAQEPLSGVSKILANHNNKYQRSFGEVYDDCKILPPPDILQSKSTFESSIQSPPVSTSSFYSRSGYSDNRVAMSPVLQVGHARTAVGALVALREAGSAHPKTLPTTSRDVPGRLLNEHKMQQQNVLPPKSRFTGNLEEVIGNVDDNDVSEVYFEDENVPYTPLSGKRNSTNDPQNRGITDDDSDFYASPSSMQQPASYFREQSAIQPDKNIVYEETNKVDISFRFRASQIGQREVQQSRRSDFHPIVFQSSSASSASCLSTARDARQQSLKNVDCTAVLPESDNGRSFHVTEQMEEAADSNDYCSYDKEDFDDALLLRKFQNQRLQKDMSKSNISEKEWIDLERCRSDNHDDGAVAEEETAAADDSNETHCKHIIEMNGLVGFDDALLRRKTRNQRQEKESFVMETIARIRDNLDLVADIEASACNSVASTGSWFTRTPLDSENLLTGFSSDQRNNLLSSIDSILSEMTVAQPEEFFASPSQMYAVASKHDTLSQALSFCRELMCSAVPRSEKKRMARDIPPDSSAIHQQLFVWKCVPELRMALGIAPPESPDIACGGGTSVFTLPEDSASGTPHTSNVSMATSITSANPRSSYSFRPCRILQHDGLQLRHNIAIICSLVQKLTLSCQQLGSICLERPDVKDAANAKKYVEACKEIKQKYLQLIGMSKDDIRAVMDAFQLDLVSSQIASADEDEQMIISNQLWNRTIFRNPFEGEAEVLHSQSGPFLKCQTNVSLERASMFSPCSEDMRTKSEKNMPHEYDDLRRQLGSYDRDENQQEEREGSPQDNVEPKEGSEEWKRMYRNVSLAASSIRSEGGSRKRGSE